MKCKGTRDKKMCLNCPYPDCLVDEYGNFPDPHKDAMDAFKREEHKRIHKYYMAHREEILTKKRSPEGRQADREYREKHKEARRLANKKYRETHAEELRAKARERWRRRKESHHSEESKQKELEYNRKYRAEHREELLQKQREKRRKQVAALKLIEEMGIEL